MYSGEVCVFCQMQRKVHPSCGRVVAAPLSRLLCFSSFYTSDNPWKTQGPYLLVNVVLLNKLLCKWQCIVSRLQVHLLVKIQGPWYTVCMLCFLTRLSDYSPQVTAPCYTCICPAWDHLLSLDSYHLVWSDVSKCLCFRILRTSGHYIGFLHRIWMWIHSEVNREHWITWSWSYRKLCAS